jgi:ubiquinone/menaquinone biosynthesis C-methylase UbiE
MPKFDDQGRHRKMMRSLKSRFGLDRAVRSFAGGDFEALGILERELLIQQGLPKDGYLIDVGCGPGRLAAPLSEYLSGRYLGLDIVPELIKYARRLVRRPDWRFEVAPGLTIPEHDRVADMVCFFSVFTHLLHEQSYLYLQEAARVLKPEGKIVFSFLEFQAPGHWPLFETAIKSLDNDIYPKTVFMGRDAISAWASHLNLRIEKIEDAHAPHITLSRPVTLESGAVLEGNVPLGQSVCVLTHLNQ